MTAYTPPKSLTRYLLLELALGAAVINVVINGLMGALVYGASPTVPMRGSGSVVSDTVLTVFIIIFFTALIVIPAARDEAEGGKVRGLGRAPEDTWWLKRLPDTPRIRAVHLATVGVLIIAPFLLAPWLLSGTEELASGTFVLYKAGAAGLAAAIATPLIGLIGLGPVDDRSAARTAPPVVAGGANYPYDYLDKACLACAEPSEGCSVAPIWRLRFTGEVSAEHLRQALVYLAERYPSLKTRTRALDALPSHAVHFAYLEDPDWRVEKMYAIEDLREVKDPDAQATAIYDHLRAEWIDMLDDPPVHVTLIQKLGGGELLWQQQHAIADGRAFIELLVDFGDYLNAAMTGEMPHIEPIHRRPEVEALETHGGTRGWFFAGAKRFVTQKMRGRSQPITKLPSNATRDFQGENDAIHLVLPDSLLEDWRPARKAIGVGLSAWLMAALLIALRRWSVDEGVSPGWLVGQLAAETRPREGFRSFANHLSIFNIRVDLTDPPDAAELMRSIQAQMVEDRDRQGYLKQVFFENKVVNKLPMHRLRRVIFADEHPATNLAFSNLIALPFPTLEGEGWKVDRVRIMTPNVPPHGVVPTVTRYNGELVFNFNLKASVVSRAQVERLVTMFKRVLDELA